MFKSVDDRHVQTDANRVRTRTRKRHSIFISFIESYYKREIAIYIELKIKTTTSERYQKISLVERR